MFKVNWGKLKHFLLNAFSFYQQQERNGSLCLKDDFIQSWAFTKRMSSATATATTAAPATATATATAIGPIKHQLKTSKCYFINLYNKTIDLAVLTAHVYQSHHSQLKLATLLAVALLRIFIKDRHCQLSKLAAQMTVAALTLFT